MTIDKSGWANIGGLNYFLDEYQQVSSKILMGLGGKEFFMPLKNERDFLDAFNCCPPLKAIVGKRAKVFNTGKTVYINPNNGKPARGAHWLKKLIKKPNVLQNEKQFFAQQNHFIDLFGYCPLLTIESAGFEGTGEYSQIWNIPPWLFDLDYTNNWLKQNKLSGIYQKFYIYWNGTKYELDSRNLKFIFDDGIGTQADCDLLIPDSRLVGMDYVISNIVAAYKSRNTLITKRGAIGILSNSAKDGAVSIPLDPTAKEELQNDFKKYGLVGQPYHIIITNASLQWQQMGFPTRDLMLFEETMENIERLCDAFGWPIELIARGKDVTYDNKVQARKDLYQNTAIPESDSRMEQFSQAIGLKDLEIRKDFSSVPVLQVDLKTKADALNAVNDFCQKMFDNDMMTKNEWLQELGREPIDRPEFNKYKSELSNTEQEDLNIEDNDNDNLDEDEEGNETSSEDSGSETEE